MNEQPPTSEDESVRTAIDTARSQLSSRRGFLAGSAAAGTLALGASGVGLGFAQDDDTDDESGSDANATVTFDDQMSDGTTVTVESVTMSEGGFVAIHDERLLDGKPLESVVGASSDLDAGSHERVQITLFDVPGGEFDRSRLMSDQTLIAMPHRDTNDNNSYDFVSSDGEADGPYTREGEAVVDDASVTITGDDVSDLAVLNYALTLEHLENAFYRMGRKTFSAEELRMANVVCSFNEDLRSEVPDYVRQVGEHEAAHVETLTSVIEDLGGDPVPEATYDFGSASEDVNAFLDTAMALENTGVSAYDGAINLIDDDELQTAGATIATVEARHASFLNLTRGENPFPSAFDEPRSMEEVEEIAGQFIVSQ